MRGSLRRRGPEGLRPAAIVSSLFRAKRD